VGEGEFRLSAGTEQMGGIKWKLVDEKRGKQGRPEGEGPTLKDVSLRGQPPRRDYKTF